MHTIAIVQARMASSRLPGKVLADLAGRSMLARVVRRVERAASVDRVVVATTDQASDDPIAAECARLGVAAFRGQATDVLDRFYRAAREYRADAFARITADCPLADPALIDECVTAFAAAGADHASNAYQRRYPRGLDVEVVRTTALERAWREARLPYERAHVTPFIYARREQFQLLPVTGNEGHSHLRWTVDTADDLRLARAIYRRLGPDDRFGWRDVLELIQREPRLAALNRAVRQKELVEG
jgi:spore coat polysaccharide biosynthesis protein SpsF (cytidylyltransferase family)